jgi:iron complex outermembrane receptor protein
VWGIDGQYDFVRAWSTTPRTATCRACLRIAPACIYYRDANWYARTGLHANQDKIGQFETPTAGYTLLNADLAYTYRHSSDVSQMTIGIKGENLLDDDVRNASPSRRTRYC